MHGILSNWMRRLCVKEGKYRQFEFQSKVSMSFLYHSDGNRPFESDNKSVRFTFSFEKALPSGWPGGTPLSQLCACSCG